MTQKDEQYLTEHFGKKESFIVPGNYFDDVKKDLIDSLPLTKHVVSIPHKKNKLLWAVGIAASLTLLCGSFATFLFNTQPNQDSKATDVSHTSMNANFNQDTQIEAAADYAMLDDIDIYAYLSEK